MQQAKEEDLVGYGYSEYYRDLDFAKCVKIARAENVSSLSKAMSKRFIDLGINGLTKTISPEIEDKIRGFKAKKEVLLHQE